MYYCQGSGFIVLCFSPVLPEFPYLVISLFLLSSLITPHLFLFSLITFYVFISPEFPVRGSLKPAIRGELKLVDGCTCTPGLLVAYEGMSWSPAPEPAPRQNPPVHAPLECPPVPAPPGPIPLPARLNKTKFI